MRTSAIILAVLAFLAPPPAAAQYAPDLGPPALEPASSGGLAAVDRALARLATHRRLLVIGAHPDDEDTSVLALVARGMGGEAGYLSLSRGEGGQNLIGGELGDGLGLLRTGELLAARRIDGARQFFTRAYDFGYTRSLEETFERWPREVLLEDALRVVRRFRPQVIVSVFPNPEGGGDGRGGHGQHQAAGVVAHEAFERAGEPHPALDAEGWPAWEPAALYRATWWDPEATTHELPIGGIEAFSGRSIFQLAMASRSQHRSQDMGMLQEAGPRASRLAWVAGAGGREAGELFAGIDTRPAAMVSGLPEGELRRGAEEELGRMAELAREARSRLSPLDPDAAVPALGEIAARLAALHGRLSTETGPAARVAAELVGEKLAIARAGLAAAGGLVLDAVADREGAAPGQEIAVTVRLFNGGSRPVTVRSARLGGLAGELPLEGAAGEIAPGEMGEWSRAVRVPRRTPPTAPYFLRFPPEGDLYDWGAVPAALRGEPLGPPELTVGLAATVGGASLELEREVVHRRRDQAEGEVRRPLRVVPRVEVEIAPSLLLWTGGEGGHGGGERVEVRLRSHVGQPISAGLEIGTPPGWPSPPALPVSLAAGEAQRHRVPLEGPGGAARGRHPVTARLAGAEGGPWDLALPLVDYPHIRPLPLPRPARLQVSSFELALPDLERVGYVRGASDRVPELLRRVGVPLEVLEPGELAGADLAAYDAIVVGSRAYEVDPALAALNPRLLGYARGGGLLVVQYQQYQFVEGGLAPFPLEIARPHDRVTDETAPVRLLEPDHRVFHHPNRIASADWEGWVQERGLYFARAWDDAYAPLLAMADPGAEELRGGLLVAPLGAGTYVYTGLAFFRQLPAGVPGGYRLFANLLALAGDRGARAGSPEEERP